MRRRMLTGLAAAVLALPQAAAGQALPTGDAVLTRYVEAMGGVAAFDAIKNRVTHARMEIAPANVVLSLTIYAAAPADLYTLVESEATGRVESGVSGGVAWERSSIRGPGVKDGAEREDALRDAIFDRLAHWREHVKSAQCVGAADVNGVPAYRVVVTPRSGSPQTMYFGQESGLLVRAETTVTSSAGTIPVVAEPGDYRKVDGILVPFRSRMTVMGQERAVTVDKVEHNVAMPADRFSLPEEIKALVKK